MTLRHRFLFYFAIMTSFFFVSEAALNPTQKDEVVELLNKNARSTIISQVMLRLEWSDTLATTARNFVTRCTSVTTAELVASKVGMQILYIPDSAPVSAAGSQISTSLFIYNYATNTCPGADQVCPAIQQMLYSWAQFVGCEKHKCSNTRILCLYQPRYETSFGKPYIPANTSCTNCPPTHPFCVDNLCTKPNITDTGTTTTEEPTTSATPTIDAKQPTTSATADSTPASMTPAPSNLLRLLALNNDFRRGTTQSASNMHALVWDAALVSIATEWLKSCDITIPNRENTTLGYYALRLMPGMTAYDNFKLNLDKGKSHYNYETNTCGALIPVILCRQYQQVVYADAKKMGCAIKRCGTEYRLACAYSAQYNYCYKPFLKGARCSACPNCGTCENSLCKWNEKRVLCSGTSWSQSWCLLLMCILIAFKHIFE